jgi:Na+-translocating ferredoxin:NAD+ oxidoreductase RnfC subunit
MKGNDIAKWVYTFLLLIAMVGWGWFSVHTICQAMDQPTTIDIIAAAGVSGLMGALITLTTLATQHRFRKKTPE